MNSGNANTRRPRISEMLEDQVEFFAPVVQTRRRTPGRVLTRFLTLMMLLILVIIIAGQTVVAEPIGSSIRQIGADSDLFRSNSAIPLQPANAAAMTRCSL